MTRADLLEFTGISRTVLEARIVVLVRLLDKIEEHPDPAHRAYLHELIEHDVLAQLTSEHRP